MSVPAEALGRRSQGDRVRGTAFYVLLLVSVTIGFLLLAVLLVVSLSGCELLPVELGGPGKGLVCHKGKKTLELPREAIGAHLDHGDYRGACH